MPKTHTPMKKAFTLIELLVVIAIMTLLMAIILPSMSSARALGKVTVCLSNLREIGACIKMYSMNNEGAIPRGPATPTGYSYNWDEWPSNQLWIGAVSQYNSLGTLLPRELSQHKVLYCPGDDSNDPSEELAKLENLNNQDVFCSYVYRQRAEQTRDRFDDMGFNAAGLRAKALAMDINSLGQGSFLRTNHDRKKVNIVYLDGHAQTAVNSPDHRTPPAPGSKVEGVFTLRGEDFMGFPAAVKTRLNCMMVAGDVAENGDPAAAPLVP